MEELIFYHSGIAEMVNVRKFVRQGPHGRGPIEKFDPFWEPNLGIILNFINSPLKTFMVSTSPQNLNALS